LTVTATGGVKFRLLLGFIHVLLKKAYREVRQYPNPSTAAMYLSGFSSVEHRHDLPARVVAART
jgi:hypothetical protein